MKFLTIITFILSSVSWSQDYGKDLKQILENFSTLESYSIKANVSVAGEEKYAFKAAIKTCKYGSHVKADISEMFINKKYAISIDHEDKTIRVDKGDYTVKGKKGDDLGLEMIDQLINDNASVEYIGKTDIYRTYVVYHNTSISKTIIKINNKTNFFHEIEVFYESDDVSISSYKVSYTEFKKNPKYKKADFDESIVFTEDADGNLSPTDAYKGYLVIKQY